MRQRIIFNCKNNNQNVIINYMNKLLKLNKIKILKKIVKNSNKSNQNKIQLKYKNKRLLLIKL